MASKRIGLKITGGILLVAAVCYGVYAFSARRGVNDQLALARKEGLWTSMLDVSSRPKPPIPDNAAVLYQPLCAIFRANGTKRNAALAHALDPGGEAAFETYYQSAKPFFDQFAVAATRPVCQFQRSWQQGEGTQFPELSDLKVALSIVCTKAILLSRHGQAGEALDLIKQFAPMAGHAGTDPVTISGLVQDGMDSNVLRALQTILGAHGREPGMPEKALLVLNALGSPPDPTLEIKGECAKMNQLFDSPETLAALVSSGNRRLGYMARVPAIRDIWQTDFLRLVRGVNSILVEGAGDPKRTLAKMRQAELSRHPNPVQDSLFVVANSSEYLQNVLDRSRRAVMRAYIEVLLAWEKTRTIPTAIPPTPDLLSGKSLQYAQISGGFKVWGSNAEGISHGGTAYNPKTDESPLEADIVYLYPWSPPVKPPAQKLRQFRPGLIPRPRTMPA